MLNELMKEVNEFLSRGNFEYAICGGYAVDLFLNRNVRRHSDIDVSAYWRDRDQIIVFMQSWGFRVYEMCGGGIAHHITDLHDQIKAKRNIFCFKDECDLVKLSPTEAKGMYRIEFDHRGQTKLDFIEFLFNNRTEDSFLYARNENIYFPLNQAILNRDGIPYLAPEPVLLYKSTDTQREENQRDFDATMDHMSDEQKDRLFAALKTIYPSGHKWLELIKEKRKGD